MTLGGFDCKPARKISFEPESTLQVETGKRKQHHRGDYRSGSNEGSFAGGVGGSVTKNVLSRMR